MWLRLESMVRVGHAVNAVGKHGMQDMLVLWLGLGSMVLARLAVRMGSSTFCDSAFESWCVQAFVLQPWYPVLVYLLVPWSTCHYVCCGVQASGTESV